MPFELTAVLLLLAGAAAGYLIGSISFAVIITKIFKNTDVREHGSGNAGMTNVMRTAGALPGTLTLACDFLKAVAAVLIGRYLLIPIMQSVAPSEAVRLAIEPVYGAFICGIGCFLGHIYPIFFGFRGGKGALVALGTLLMIDWQVFLIVAAVFLIMFFFTKIVSLSTLTAAVVYPVATFLLFPYTHLNETALFGISSRLIQTAFASVIVIIVFIKHIDNIKRLIAGEEKAIVRGSKPRGGS
ncbi:MAG TPA: acyl-phosphate glycerol 3-phosphate acyltransferase [Ruminococcaceae bacterium]|nr:acyl-phosphate glycerol 3-phosphate acyltransferase [Oscillospiraceae bacterium]